MSPYTSATWSSPNVRVLGPDAYRLQRDWSYIWVHGDDTHRIRINAGFTFDGASVPKIAHPLIGRWDLGLGPPLVHDALYHAAGCLACVPTGATHEMWDTGNWRTVNVRWTRKETDRLFGRHMREAGVARWRRRLGYRAVRLGGFLPWWRADTWCACTWGGA